MTIEDCISKLNLEPHPEGGYFRETYRSELSLQNLKDFEGERSCSTGIYFLLTSASRSHLHKIKSDEMWHFYLGDPIRIVMLNSEGVHSECTLGRDLASGHHLQFVVPKGVWFGAEVLKGGEHGLAGCTVAPGFDFADFEMAKREELVAEWPQHKKFLEEFCIS
ncbi:MAG: cupin domain-containing protein [Bdellovibrionales bacterium]|nr:cupin domain-containing protein [Bdellovibrionales bacterium]